MISRQSIQEFLERDLRDSSKAKAFTPEAIDTKMARLDPQPTFVLPPKLHQKVAFLLGLKYPRYMWLLDPGLGKALPDDELVLTPTGFVCMRDLVVGDRVIGSSGEPTCVTGVFLQGKKEVFKVRFSDGSSVRCCGEHLWKIRKSGKDRVGYPWKVSRLLDFKDDLRGPPSPSTPAGYRKWFIPVVNPVVFDPPGPLPIPPYTMGVLLGNGALSSGHCEFCVGDLEVVEHVKLEVGTSARITAYKQQEPTVWDFGCPDYRLLIKQLNLNVKSKVKFVPDVYLKSSPMDRHSILQGLLDTDASATPQGCFDFCSVSRSLAEGVKWLTTSLGGSAKFTEYQTETNYTHGKKITAYSVMGRLPKQFPPFRLSRKQAIINKGKLGPYRAVVSVESIGEESCRCISVAADDGLFVTKDFIVTHNSKVNLDLFVYRKEQLGIANRALVFVPNTANLGQWKEEVAIHAPQLVCEAVDSSGREDRLLIINGMADVVVITYAGFLSLVCKGKPAIDEITGQVKKDKDGQPITKGWVCDEKKLKIWQDLFDTVIFDEIAVLLGTHDSLLMRTCKKLVKPIRYRYGLTGTPIGRNPMKAWPQFNLVDDGDTFGQTLGIFRGALFTEKPGYFGGTEYTFDKKRAEDFNRMLRHGSLRYEIEECADLPPLIPVTRKVSLDRETWAYYDKLIDELKEADGNFKLIDNVFYRMRGLVAGFLSYRDSEDERAEIIFKKNKKMDALVEWIQEIPDDRKIIVFVDLVITGNLVSDRLKKEKISHSRLYSATKDKNGEIEKFKSDPKRKILLSSRSGGFGLNLQVAKYILFYESPTSPDIRRQMVARAWRQGQTDTVVVGDIVVKGSVDVKIQKALQEGRDLHQLLIEGEPFTDEER